MLHQLGSCTGVLSHAEQFSPNGQSQCKVRRLLAYMQTDDVSIHNYFGEKAMFSLLGTIFVGLIVGFIARAVKPGDDKLGWIMTAVLGVGGSFLANFVGQSLGWYKAGATAGYIASVVGAVILLVIYGFVKSKTGGPSA
jgi:uncharacterized membrane protein YeaQ/YmgE (transglycosylase-associated protein family)